jgi:hypothetical protein
MASMRRKLIVSLSLAALLAAALGSTLAWSRAKSSPGCPRRTPEQGAPCKHKHADCHWRCEGEGHSNLACSCEQDEHGAWRWQCGSVGPPCTL